ncbi:MAG: S-methyl-5-thioribose-1-phosphate isomerase, partial [Lachnospiraceae bacterium]
MDKENHLTAETVDIDLTAKELIIIDQTKLPGETRLIRLKTAQEIWEAIYLLKVRGAPAIGIAAAFGIYILAARIEAE